MSVILTSSAALQVVFQVRGSNLSLVDKKSSGGAEPNAVAQHGGLVYVLNVGGSSNVVGFKLYASGHLKQIPNSTRFLTTNNSEAASVAFSPDGQFLLVTERATSNIDAFHVQSDGTLGSIVVSSDPEDCRDPGPRLSTRETCLPSYRRNSFPVDGSPGSMRSF
jgi:DNA-binding beta-propeller fold protein YncE